MTNSEAIEFIEVDVPFDELRQRVVDHVIRWGKGDRSTALDLSMFNAIVAIKNSDRLITAENSMFRDILMGGRSSLGGNVDASVGHSFKKVMLATDRLILDGVASLELEHVGTPYHSRPCTYVTYKRRLDELRDPSYVILTVCRPLAYVGTSEIERRRSLSELRSLLQQLDVVDQDICGGYARGDSSKEIGIKVGLATRSIEIRRQKILDHFGFKRPIEIVKMLVRLEEHGLT